MPEKKTELSWDHSVVRGWLVMDREREAAEPLLVAIEAGERSLSDLSRAEWRLLRGVALIERLLDWSARRRYQDPAGMIHLAQLALGLVQQLGTRRYGRKLLADLGARTWIELANAYRVADDLPAAEIALGKAGARLAQGTKSVRLIARLADVAASFASDERRFADSVQLATVAVGCFQEVGDFHLMGRALISKGIYTGYSDRPEEGIALIVAGLKSIDLAQASQLAVSAVHTILCNLVDIGACREAKGLLSDTRNLFERDNSFLNQLRLRWLEGRIALGLEDLKAAAEDFENVRQGFKLVHQTFDAALVSLDLSLVYARQGRQKEIFALAEEMIATFRSLRISREAIASLAVLRKACEQPAASAELLAGHIRSCAAVVTEAQRGRAGKG